MNTQLLERQSPELARAIVDRCFRERPELDLRYGAIGREKCLQDTRFHLQYLVQAVAAESEALFLDYVRWAKVMLAGVRVPEKDVVYNLELMEGAIRDQIGESDSQLALGYLRAAIAAVPEMPATSRSFVDTNGRHGLLAITYLNTVLAGMRREASELIMRAVDTGTPVREIYLHVFQPAQHEIGRLWQTNQISVAQEHYCTAVTQMIMSQLYPRILASQKNGKRMLATCVGSELHEIGIRMVADFLELEGWDTFYLGANTPASAIIKTIKERRIDCVAISATMTYHIELVGNIIKNLRADEGTHGVKILVGGYPFNVDKELWRRIGADGYGSNAEETARVAGKLVGL